MSSGERPTPKQITAYALAAVVLVGAGFVLFGGWGGKAPSGPATQVAADPAGEALAAARDALSKGSDLNSCRVGIRNLNLYLSHNPPDKPSAWTDVDRQRLGPLFDLDAGEWSEVASATFTPLDAHYLDLCFLMRDVARALDLGDLAPQARAAVVFDWVVRQVRLEGDQPPAPPEFVLRRGSGTALERSLVFLALLDQLGLEGCLIVCPQAKEGGSAARPWTAAVLVGSDLLLFDPRLGMPLPGPDGQGIATLAEVRAQPQLLRALTVDGRYPYDVTPEQVQGAQIHLICPLSALAPRLKYTERMLASDNPVKLTVDPFARLEKFTKATAGRGLQVRWWSAAGDPFAPVSVLRRFLPPQEGGADTSMRKAEFVSELIPWQYLPPPITHLPARVPPGSTLRHDYALLFLSFPLPRPRTRDDMPAPSDELAAQRFLRYFWSAPTPEARAAEEFGHFLLTPGSPRDHMLRGRFDQAITQLVQTQDQVKQQKALLRAEAGLPDRLATWCAHAERAQAALFKAEREWTRDHTAETQAALDTAQRALDAVWQGLSDPDLSRRQEGKDLEGTPVGLWRLPPWLPAVVGSAALPMDEEAGYLLALCKQDQAERLQARQDYGPMVPAEREASQAAWRAAAERWETYLENYSSSWRSAVARTLRARALSALGDRKAAVALLEDLSGNLSPLEKTARLYQAHQLQQRP